MATISPIDIAAVSTAVLTMCGTAFTARVQAKSNRATARNDRIAKLEGSLGEMYNALGAEREKHYNQLQKLLDEEELLRDRFEERLAVKRERIERMSLQVTGLRAELLRRGVNPDRVDYDNTSVPVMSTQQLLSAMAGPDELVGRRDRRAGDNGGVDVPIVSGRRHDDPAL